MRKVGVKCQDGIKWTAKRVKNTSKNLLYSINIKSDEKHESNKYQHTKLTFV